MLEILTSILRPDILLLILAGVAIGNIFGCIPGLNAPIAVALALPVTFLLDTVPAMGLILGLYFGATSGGLVSAILLRIPGMGGGAASLISYEHTKKTSKHPETFGTGEPAGIFSCESANNAVTGGALVPMLSLGVPGDTVASIIMGAMLLQGVTPGPLLSMNHPELFRSILVLAFVATIIMYVYQASTIRGMAQIARIPKAILMPIITMFCLTGTISIRNNMFDLVYVMAIAVLGYIFDKNGYPFAPFILANVLGETLESNLRRAIMHYGSFGNCCQQLSIGTVFFFLAIALPIGAIVLRQLNRKKAK